MADTVVNSVDPATIGPDMVAYLLTVSIVGGEGYGKGHASINGLPVIHGSDKETILKTFAQCRRVVSAPHLVDKALQE